MLCRCVYKMAESFIQGRKDRQIEREGGWRVQVGGALGMRSVSQNRGDAKIKVIQK